MTMMTMKLGDVGLFFFYARPLSPGKLKVADSPRSACSQIAARLMDQ